MNHLLELMKASLPTLSLICNLEVAQNFVVGGAGYGGFTVTTVNCAFGLGCIESALGFGNCKK